MFCGGEKRKVKCFDLLFQISTKLLAREQRFRVIGTDDDSEDDDDDDDVFGGIDDECMVRCLRPSGRFSKPVTTCSSPTAMRSAQ